VGRELVAVAVGGALGALARWGLLEAFPHGDGFPWATLGINVSGSALLALLATLAAVRARPLLAIALGPGLLGGFTTLSTYAEETRVLAEAGRPLLAAAYVVGTLAACLAAVALVHRVRGGHR
jgi:CrcB protein